MVCDNFRRDSKGPSWGGNFGCKCHPVSEGPGAPQKPGALPWGRALGGGGGGALVRHNRLEQMMTAQLLWGTMGVWPPWPGDQKHPFRSGQRSALGGGAWADGEVGGDVGIAAVEEDEVAERRRRDLAAAEGEREGGRARVAGRHPLGRMGVRLGAYGVWCMACPMRGSEAKPTDVTWCGGRLGIGQRGVLPHTPRVRGEQAASGARARRCSRPWR